MIDVTEYSRCLGGGGGVPSDGTLMTLGLGFRTGSRREPVAVERSGKRKLDEDVPWVPSADRAAMLKVAMGAAFDDQWEAHRLEMAQLRASRRQNCNDEDWHPMPTSLEEA